MKLEKKRYDDDEDEEQLLRELSKLFIDFFMDLFVSFPTFILFLYYMYYNDDEVYAISFDVAFAIYFFHGVFRFFSSICYDMDMNTYTHDWISQLFFMSLIIKTSMIACIFGIIYLIGYIKGGDIEKSIFLLIVSIIFCIFGCIAWCLICYVCACSCICGGSSSGSETGAVSKLNTYTDEDIKENNDYDHHGTYIQNRDMFPSP